MKLIRIVTEIILVLLEITGATGGILMIVSSLRGSETMPLSLLQHSPFHSYLIPGIILLCANGLFPAFVLTQALKRAPKHALWIVAQGGVLLGWIVVQCILLRIVNGLQISYGLIAIALVVCGAILQRSDSSAVAN